MIKNIIFDMGNVLIRWSPDEMMKSLGVCDEDRKTIMKQLFREWEWIAMDAGEMNGDQCFESVSQRVEERLHPLLKKLIEWWKMPFDEEEGMDELIESLFENGYRIYVLSNADINQEKYMEKIPGNRFLSGRVTSAEIGLIKPDRKIYEHLCDKYDLKKEECLFIDDSNLNVFAAKQFGMNAVVYHDIESLKETLRSYGIEF